MSEDTVFVVDIGSSSVKAGYSGDDIPAFVFPSTSNKPTARNVEVSQINFSLLSPGVNTLYNLTILVN